MSPRRWLNDSSTSPSHLVVPPAALCPAAVASDRCDCVYSSDLQPCGCPRFFQTSSAALSPSLPDVTSELCADDHEVVVDDDGRRFSLARDCGSPSLPTTRSSTVCLGCSANVDAGPLPTSGDHHHDDDDDQQQQQQQPAVDATVTCWRSDEDVPFCLTPQRRPRASSTDAASEPITITPWQAST